MGYANTFINDWDAKFTYNFWRPITAIRNGDNDGNDATERDAGWLPLNDTPMHPEYPSQASIIAGMSVGILESVFGPKPAIAYTVTDFNDASLKRQYPGITRWPRSMPMCGSGAASTSAIRSTWPTAWARRSRLI